MMFKLLMQRGAVLFLRPAVVLAEGYLVPGGNVLIYVLPIAALALTASSIPVHSQYMRTLPSSSDFRAIERSYVSGLLQITLISQLVLTAALLIIWPSMSSLMLTSTIAMFVIEKFSDELTRFYEFHKEFRRWGVTQSLRSAWPFIPICLSQAGMDYVTSFAAVALVFAIIVTTKFFTTTRLPLAMGRSGWNVIRSNLVFLNSAGLLATHRQVPRIVVAHLFPHVAHLFQAVAQIGQGVSLLFNVRFAVPYRAIISRRTMMFERRMGPIFSRMMWGSIGMSAAALLAVPIADTSGGNVVEFLALPVALVADSLAFSLMSTYWGYLPWQIPPRQTLLTYVLAGCVLAIVAGVGYLLLAVGRGSVVLVPCLTVIASVSWVRIIKYRHFDSGSRNVVRELGV
jgi:hypothetical protein